MSTIHFTVTPQKLPPCVSAAYLLTFYIVVSTVSCRKRKQQKDFVGRNGTGLRTLSLMGTLFCSFSADTRVRHTAPRLKPMMMKDGTTEAGIPEPHHTSARWQSLSPGSLQRSTTSLQTVSGVTGTSVKCCSLLLRYTVRNIWKQKEKRNSYQYCLHRCWSLSTHLGFLSPDGLSRSANAQQDRLPVPWPEEGRDLELGRWTPARPPLLAAPAELLGIPGAQSNKSVHTKGRIKFSSGNSLALKWLRLRASNAGDVGSMPGQGSHMPCGTAKKKNLPLTFYSCYLFTKYLCSS